MFGVLTGKRHMIDDDDGQDQVVATSTARICADCKTSKTPLWRSGPHGPKSLCNACGIRYRKRRRREFEFLKMGKDISMKEKKNGHVVDEEGELLVLQGKFAGKEEAEAALLLMALSCGLCVR
ncbi:GATA transcription factor 23-like [Telopea speciosissima]|uniref:GATA transcription factor 23-like n=1 Tax=Telopea speciosissima TaxID=54955 RepID=UPI001CC70031|nr:GATA transcription factor 23-like [Telopea speciosissima]